MCIHSFSATIPSNQKKLHARACVSASVKRYCVRCARTLLVSLHWIFKYYYVNSVKRRSTELPSHSNSLLRYIIFFWMRCCRCAINIDWKMFVHINRTMSMTHFLWHFGSIVELCFWKELMKKLRRKTVPASLDFGNIYVQNVESIIGRALNVYENNSNQIEILMEIF